MPRLGKKRPRLPPLKTFRVCSARLETADLEAVAKSITRGGGARRLQFLRQEIVCL
jgi:hypothetical protein